MEKYSINYQYRECLKRLGMDESKMIPEQKRQLKLMFFTASAQMLLLLRDDLAELPELEACHVLDGMLTEIREFITEFMEIRN
jgi:hypothetical protein